MPVGWPAGRRSERDAYTALWMDDLEGAEVEQLLAGAEVWAASPSAPGSSVVIEAAPASPGEPALVAGWEDGYPFCEVVCTTDVGLAFCRRCPVSVVGETLETGRSRATRCPAGVSLLAFPVPAGARDRIAVLRVAPPAPRDAAAVAATVRVSPVALRRAARDVTASPARAVRTAARRLRDPAGLLAWQGRQRERAASRRRMAAAALAQMIATSEEFHVLFRSSERQRNELDRNQRRIERLARDAFRATDSERARIAHQIHDTAAQSMVSAWRFLDAARAAPDGLPPSVDAHLAEASERVRTAIREVRAVLDALLPPGLEELGLTEALRIRLRDLTAATPTAGVVRGRLPRLQGWVEQALYGMTGEAISNAIRHGDARRITVTLGERRGRALIEIADDGRGFDPATIARRRGDEGLGLLGMTRQARWLGGHVDITSAPGAGTTIRTAIPLERHRAPATTDEKPTMASATISIRDLAGPERRSRDRRRHTPADGVTAGRIDGETA
jgi:signal transduction histidine kinase